MIAIVLEGRNLLTLNGLSFMQVKDPCFKSICLLMNVMLFYFLLMLGVTLHRK